MHTERAPDGPFPTLHKHGGARAKGNQGADGTLVKRGSNSRAYVIARLDRDGLDDLADHVRAGTLSARRAAIAAGFGQARKSSGGSPLEEVEPPRPVARGPDSDPKFDRIRALIG